MAEKKADEAKTGKKFSDKQVDETMVSLKPDVVIADFVKRTVNQAIGLTAAAGGGGAAHTG